jgi:hypothetical protein
MVDWRISPLSRRGSCAINKKSGSFIIRADGVVINHQQFLLEFTHHPGRSIKEASRYFIEVAATPPRRGGEIPAGAKFLRRSVAKTLS